MNFKPDELEFLKRHGVKPEDVYDAQGQSSSKWKREVERLGKTLVLGTPCQAAHHRLRTRAGHCVQCDPKKIAYQNRHRAPGYVYIAGSLVGRVLKIGTAVNIAQRENNLRGQRYGGLSDWVICFHMKVNEGGRVEHDALAQLKKHRSTRQYEKDGAIQEAGEILTCTLGQAIKALADAIGSREKSDVWHSYNWKLYEFE